MASNRRMSGCMQHEEQVGDDCLSSMTDAEFSIYTAFLNEVTSLCFHIAQSHWRSHVNELVTSLVDHASDTRRVRCPSALPEGAPFSAHNPNSSQELEIAATRQKLLLDTQDRSLSLQSTLLSGLADAEDRMASHTHALGSIIQHAETSLGIQAFLASHLMFLQSLGWYACALASSLLLTSTTRTAASRLPIIGTLLLGSVVEWRMTRFWTQQLGAGALPAQFKLGQWHVQTTLASAGSQPVAEHLYTSDWTLEEACWGVRWAAVSVCALLLVWGMWMYVDHGARTAAVLSTLDVRVNTMSSLLQAVATSQKPYMGLSEPHTPPRIQRLPELPAACGPSPSQSGNRSSEASDSCWSSSDGDDLVISPSFLPWLHVDTDGDDSDAACRSPPRPRSRGRARSAALAARRAIMRSACSGGLEEPVQAFEQGVAASLQHSALELQRRVAILHTREEEDMDVEAATSDCDGSVEHSPRSRSWSRE